MDAFDPLSSAAEADLRPGDILFQVDGQEVETSPDPTASLKHSFQVIGMPVTSIAEKLFGPVGTQATLDVKLALSGVDTPPQVMITILRGGLNGEVVLVQLERRSSANAA